MFKGLNGQGTAASYPVHAPLEAKPTGVDLYARFALAGALGCAITHGAATPMDVVKTRIQLQPEVYNRVRIHCRLNSLKSRASGKRPTSPVVTN